MEQKQNNNIPEIGQIPPLEQLAILQMEEGRKQVIEKACWFLKNNLQNYIEDDWTSEQDFIEEFRKTMEE